jgi:hypothetical protein
VKRRRELQIPRNAVVHFRAKKKGSKKRKGIGIGIGIGIGKCKMTKAAKESCDRSNVRL